MRVRLRYRVAKLHSSLCVAQTTGGRYDYYTRVAKLHSTLCDAQTTGGRYDYDTV